MIFLINLNFIYMVKNTLNNILYYALYVVIFILFLAIVLFFEFRKWYKKMIVKYNNVYTKLKTKLIK